MFVVVAIGAPLAEEIYFRGLRPADLRPKRPARASPSWPRRAFFAATHIQLLQFPALLVFGLILGYLAWRTGRLGPAIWAHVGLQHRHRRQPSCSTSVEADGPFCRCRAAMTAGAASLGATMGQP